MSGANMASNHRAEPLTNDERRLLALLIEDAIWDLDADDDWGDEALKQQEIDMLAALQRKIENPMPWARTTT